MTVSRKGSKGIKGRKGGEARNQLRIIAGQWRRRRLAFPDIPELRPTADRVRETLFNWLQARVPGARCLDLYAGSGACGLEALSRGASSVLFVERSRVAVEAIRGNLGLLKADNGRVLCTDVESWLPSGPGAAGQEPFDLVFIDPPYASGRLPAVCTLLETAGWLNADARIYLESGHPVTDDQLPQDWQLIRSDRAGQVYYCLCQNSTPPQA
jgi:16S rRNA (guanine966-N2)-methyltransferase